MHRTKPAFRRVLAGVAATFALALSACEAGNPLFPDTGTVEVTVQGNLAAPSAGLTVTLDGNRTRTINQIPGTAAFENTPSGTRQVQLSGLPQNCSAVSNPRTVNLVAGGIVRTTFLVSCLQQ